MSIADTLSGTRIDEVAEGVFRIHTPIPPGVVPGGFSFNQYLLVDEDPLLFHTGSRSLFPLVTAAIRKVMPLEKLRYVAFSHYEQDECGSVNELLAAAPRAEPVCGKVMAMINGDGFDRRARALADGERLPLGRKAIRWIDAPHLPHGWECGYAFEESTRTLLCGDLFTQGGSDCPPLVERDILGPSEAMRARGGDYFAHSRDTARLLGKLAETSPRTLACMHGSAWTGDGAGLLHELSRALSRPA